MSDHLAKRYYPGDRIRSTVDDIADFDGVAKTPTVFEVTAKRWYPTEGPEVVLAATPSGGKIVAYFTPDAPGRYTITTRIAQPVQKTVLKALTVESLKPHPSGPT